MIEAVRGCVMVIDSVSTLVDLVTKHRLLEPLQQDELVRELQAQHSDAKQLARAMIERDWLTSLQINYLFQGRIGELVLGSYIVRERLGESRAGLVFKARHLHLRRIAAVKVIREELLADPRVLERFYQEIQATSSLAHPHIVHAYDAGPVGKTHFVATEYVKGTDLWRLVKKAGSITVPQACEYISQTALGLQNAYERGLLHLDVKPGNLLVTRSSADTPAPSTTPSPTAPPSSKTFRAGLIKIRNLGLTALEDPASALFVNGRFLGDPDVRAPELADPSARPDVRSELYSLGCTFYFLLTGQPPFPEGTSEEKMHRHRTEEPVAVEVLRPGVPPGVQTVLNTLLAKNPEERYRTPVEVCSALNQLSSSGSSVNLSSLQDREGSGITTFRRLLSALGLRARKQATNLVGAGSSLRLRAARASSMKLKLAAAAILALVLVGAYLLFRGSPGTREPGDDSLASGKLVSALDGLDGKLIAKMERPAGFKDELVAVLGSHRGRHWQEATCIAFSPDGKLLASGGADKEIRIWDAETLEESAILRGHIARISSLSFASDSQTLASSSDDATVRVWQIGKTKPESEIKGQASAVAFAPNARKLACASADKFIHIWDISGPTPAETKLTGHAAAVNALAFSSDGNWLASGGADNLVRMWDVKTGKPREPPFKGHTLAVTSVAFSPDGKLIASGSLDKSVRLWKLDEPAPVDRPLLGHAIYVRSVAFSPDGKTLVSSGDDRSIRLWNVGIPAPQQLVAITAHANRVNAVAFSPDGKTLASAGEDTSVRLWNVAGPATNERTVHPGHYGAVTTLALSADLKSLASGGIDGTARVWDLSKSEPKERVVLRGHPVYVSAVKFMRDDQALLTSCVDGSVRVWDLNAAGKPEMVMPGLLPASGATIAVSPDGKQLVTFADGKLFLWDTLTNKKRDWLTLPVAVTTLLYSPDGRHVITGNLNGTIYVFRLPIVLKTK